MKQIDSKVMFFIAFIILGIAISVQIKTIDKNLKQIDYSKYYNDLQAQLNSERSKSLAMKKQIDDITSQKDKYLKASLTQKNDQLLKEWNEVRLLAGFVGVKGKGIVIDITDRTVKSNTNSFNSSDYLVHANDIVRLLNELKISGAQALSVNEERILPISEIICTGPTIKINRNRYPAPYEIKAIGDQDLMLSVLNESSIMAELKSYIKVQVTRDDKIVIPGFKGDSKRYITGVEVVEK